MLGRAVRFWVAPRMAMRQVLDAKPGERGLLGLAVLAILIFLVGHLLQQVVLPAGGVAIADSETAGDWTEWAAQMAGAGLIAAAFVLLFLLVFYVLAAFGTLLARIFGGQGGWHEGRAAFFWAVLMAAPVLVVADTLPLLTELPPQLTAAVSQLGIAVLAWALAQCFAEAFGFRLTWAVFAVLAALILVPLGLWWLWR